MAALGHVTVYRAGRTASTAPTEASSLWLLTCGGAPTAEVLGYSRSTEVAPTAEVPAQSRASGGHPTSVSKAVARLPPYQPSRNPNSLPALRATDTRRQTRMISLGLRLKLDFEQAVGVRSTDLLLAPIGPEDFHADSVNMLAKPEMQR